MTDLLSLIAQITAGQQGSTSDDVGQVLKDLPALFQRKRRPPSYIGNMNREQARAGGHMRIPHQLTPGFVGLLGNIRAKKESLLNPLFAKGMAGAKTRQ